MAGTDSLARFSLSLRLAFRWVAVLCGLAGSQGTCGCSARSATLSVLRSIVNVHRSAGLQALLPVDHDLISDRNSTGDQSDISLRQIHLDGLHVRLAGLNGVDVRTLCPALDRRERNDDGVLAHSEH